jgi:uncharacterized protein involved in exopolysaccharide biosynthesis
MMDLGADLGAAGPAAPDPGPPPRPGLPVEPRRLLAALVRARLLLATAAVTGAALGLGAAKTLARAEYEAATVITWQPRAGGPPLPPDQELQTLVESVKLPEILAAVRTEIDLPMTVEALAGAIDVRGSKKSRLITITATAPDGEQAARMANAIARCFAESRRDAQKAELDARVRDLGEAVLRARADAEKARRAYDAFHREHGIVDLDAERQASLEQLSRFGGEANLSGANADAEAARAQSLARSATRLEKKMVRQETESSPAEFKVAEASAEIARLRSRLSSDHPKIQSLEAEVETLRANAGKLPPAPMSRTVGVNPQWEAVQSELTDAEALQAAASTRRSALSELARKARERLSWLAKIEGEGRALSGDIRNLEQYLAKVTADHAAAVDAAGTPDPGVRLLSEAAAPTLPARSSKKKIAIAGPVAALVLTLLFVVIRNLWKLRGHATTEIAFWSSFPVVASTPWPAALRGGRALAEDLAIELVGAPGTTLLAPFSEAERPTAARIERRLRTSDALRGRGGDAQIRFLDGRDAEALRRASRQADRVVLIVEAGRHPGWDLSGISVRLGRDDHVGLVVVGVGPDVIGCADRVGSVDRFWSKPIQRRGVVPAGA